MNIRQKIDLCLLLYIVLGSAAFAQVVDIPDPNLRATIADELNIHRGAPITQKDMHLLTHLDIGKRGITNLTGLESATNLISLVISDDSITDLSPIADLTQLESLFMWETRRVDIAPLANLTNLRNLTIQACNIVDISPLTTLTQLTSLNARYNRIIDITPLANLTNLVELRLTGNHISDVTPLSHFTRLDFLEIQHNRIADHSPIDGLALSHFRFDQTCEMPPLPLEPRWANRDYPSIFSRFGVPSANRPDLSHIQNLAHHDLVFDRPLFGLAFTDMSYEIVVAGPLDEAIQIRDEYLAINPNMVFIVEVKMRSHSKYAFPEDWPYWIRNSDNKPVPAWSRGSYLVNFTHPYIQDRIVQQAIAVSKCGLYDGIFFDWWVDDGPILNDYVDNAAEQRARDNILQRVRAETRPDFLIMGNTNDRVIRRTGPHINGGFMETSTPNRTVGDILNTNISLSRIENSLLWLEQNLREPTINALEGQPFSAEPLDSPNNLRWMRAFTTLSLTHSDGYVLFHDDTGRGHYWYDFWDADLGRPVGAKAQLYDEDIPGFYLREFTNGWAVYNHSGEPQKITLPEEVFSAASGLTNTRHTLPNIDGGIYLKMTTPVDTPDINESDIYNAEPIDAVPGALLHLDASNNSGTITHWVNLGTAGGRLLASDRLPTIEEGEIEIPSIGFSGRRKYYTATSPREIFGGPVQANPKLYLGDWTLEFLCKRNGNRFIQEHQFAGFQNTPREELQGIRLRLLIDGRELELSIHVDGFKQPERALNIYLEENVWTWVTVVSINGEAIIAYQDGVEVSRHPGVHFDTSLPLDDISIGSNSYDERRRNFNGSFSIVRVYDRPLSPDEVLQNIGATVIPIANPADVNGDGVVNILDLVVVAQVFGKDGLQGDVNGDGVVNVFDLVFVAGEIGGAAAAPSAYSLDPTIISAADVERWLALAQGIGIGDANFQRGIRFLEGLLAALTPKETTLLPNFPNPFNPETWIPYRLVREAEVAITIYDAKGTPVRRLTLGNQVAGHYTERGKAAYWDGRNEDGEAVASGIYIYQFRAGEYAASRRMVIVK